MKRLCGNLNMWEDNKENPVTDGVIDGLTVNFLVRAAIEENAYNRMKKVVKWYISGFYKKPKVHRIRTHIRLLLTLILHKTPEYTVCFPSITSLLLFNLQGLKKPYNPIIGETFRCMWLHQKTNSKTFYIAEQVRAALHQKSQSDLIGQQLPAVYGFVWCKPLR